jgi:septum formation protein
MHAPHKYSGKPTTDTTQPRLVLASASPRRRELLALLDVPFSVVPTADAEERDDPIPETIIARLPACPLALRDHPTIRAWRKANAACEHAPEDIVLAADTVVVLDNQPLNKPTNAAHARAMLAALAGRTHTVYTGMCVVAPQREHSLLDLVASNVTMLPLTAHQIAAYVATGEPLDKAGSYAIQGEGGMLVQQLVGSYTGVMGLPLPATWRLLTDAGLSTLRDPTDAYHTWLQEHQKEMLPCPPTLP